MEYKNNEKDWKHLNESKNIHQLLNKKIHFFLLFNSKHEISFICHKI